VKLNIFPNPVVPDTNKAYQHFFYSIILKSACSEIRLSRDLYFNCNEKSGTKWLKNFLLRHTEISVRTPEGLSLSRARGFTPESVAQFLQIHKPAMGTIEHKPARIYNCDETGVTIVLHKHTKILGLEASIRGLLFNPQNGDLL
jgi:hypothetical protein